MTPPAAPGPPRRPWSRPTTTGPAIVDLGLPDSDGYTLVTALHSDPATAAMRIVILTGHLPDEQAAKAAVRGPLSVSG